MCVGEPDVLFVAVATLGNYGEGRIIDQAYIEAGIQPNEHC